MIGEIDKKMYINLLSNLSGFVPHMDYVDGSIIKTNNWNSYLYSKCFPYWQNYTFEYNQERNEYLIKHFPFTDYKLFLNTQIPLDFKEDQIFKDQTKYIIPFELNKSNTDIYIDKRYNDGAIEKIKQSGLNPLDCIITEIYLKTKGNSLENFVEYLTCKLFIEEGYLVENQPFFADLDYNIQIKNPDFGAYSIPDIQQMLKNYGILNGGGFLNELNLFRIRGKGTKTNQKILEEEQFIVGEAKTGPSGKKKFIEQAKYYYGRGYFHRFVQITPSYNKFENWYDYIKFHENGQISHIIPEIKKNIYRKEQGEMLRGALIKKIKFYLLQNFYFIELLELIGSTPNSLFHLNKKISKLKIEDILNFLKTIK